MFEVYFQLSVRAFNLNPVSHVKICREIKGHFHLLAAALIQTNKALELKRDSVIFVPRLLLICALYYYTEAFLFFTCAFFN